jgi:hypothetical protein
MSETIQLTETSRLRVVVDEGAHNPRDDYQMTGFVKIPGRGDSRLIDVLAVHDDTIGIAEAHDRVPGSVSTTQYRTEEPRAGVPYRYPIDPDENVCRWARIFHDMHVEYDSEHGGYWFVDPQQMRENWPGPDYPEGRSKVEQEAEVIRQEQEVYRQWADGEVYGVILERAVTWAKLNADGQLDEAAEYETREEWEHVASLWGCYLDDDYTPQVVAVEYFDLTDEEMVPLADIAGSGKARVG